MLVIIIVSDEDQSHDLSLFSQAQNNTLKKGLLPFTAEISS